MLKLKKINKVILIPIFFLGSMFIINKLVVNIKEKEHRNNFLCLKGSPWGITGNRLLSAQIEIFWERGRVAKTPVFPDAKDRPFKTPKDFLFKAGYYLDQLKAAKKSLNTDWALPDVLSARFRKEAEKKVLYSFELNPTNGSSLQLSYFFLSQSNTIPLEEKIERINNLHALAMQSYNLDPEKGNPLHALDASDATFGKFLALQEQWVDLKEPLKSQVKENASKDSVKLLELSSSLLIKRYFDNSWKAWSDGRVLDFWNTFLNQARLIERDEEKRKKYSPSVVIRQALKKHFDYDNQSEKRKLELDEEFKEWTHDLLPNKYKDLFNGHSHGVNNEFTK